MSNSFKKANAFLPHRSEELESIFAKVQKLEELNKALISFLDPTIQEYCQAANLIGHKLVVLVANGSIATQLRFQSADLIKKFRQHSLLAGVDEIQCKVRPPLAPSARATPRPRGKKMQPLSAETAEIVREMAETISDPKLKEIMERIAGRNRK